MFTGLIEKQSQVIQNHQRAPANRLLIRTCFSELMVGESIAVNGVCLTLLPSENESYMAFDVSPETLDRTTLGQLTADDVVHLERAMQANGRLGGHYVSGHVDTTARIQAVTPVGEYLELVIGGFEHSAMRYFLPKGSIALDGVSLTINEVGMANFTVLLVPHTLANTTFGGRQVGDWVNVEFDYLTRVIAHQVEWVIQREKACSIE